MADLKVHLIDYVTSPGSDLADVEVWSLTENRIIWLKMLKSDAIQIPKENLYRNATISVDGTLITKIQREGK